MNVVSPDGFIREWVLLGPFPSPALKEPTTAGVTRAGFDTDYLTELGGETRAVLSVGSAVHTKTASGAEKTLTAYAFKSWDTGHLCDQSLDHHVGYAFTDVESDQDQTVYVYFGSDGSPKVWINGQLVFSTFRAKHKTTPWEYSAKVAIKKGRNHVLVKLDNDRGWWGFQTEWYREQDHAGGIVGALKGLGTRSLAVDRMAGRIVVDPKPMPIGFEMPVQAELLTLDKKLLATGAGRTGQVIEIKGDAPIEGAVRIVLSSGEGAVKSLCSEEVRYLGDYAAASAALARRLAAARGNIAKLPEEWRPAYGPLVLFLEGFLAAKTVEPDSSDINNSAYAAAFVAALERQENYVADHLGDDLPAAFPPGASGGAADSNTFNVRLPRGFSPAKVAHPLRIFLHGSGGMGQKATHKQGDGSEPARSTAGVAYVQVNPLSGKQRWNIDVLNRMLEQVKTAYSIDAERIYLGGHSLGGMCTFAWAIANPEHFAALQPMSGGGDPLRAARLVNIPVWAFQGDKDMAVAPFDIERTLSALKAAGGVVKYTLYPDAGHTLDISKEDVIGFFNQHVRSTKPAPADPVAALGIKDGVSAPAVKDLPAMTCVAVSGSALPDELEETALDQLVNLYNAQRQGGRWAQGSLVVCTSGEVDKEAKITFRTLLPVEAGVRPTTAPQAAMRSETLPTVRAWCFYYQGTPKGSEAAIAKARQAAMGKGVKLTGEVRQVMLQIPRGDRESIREIQLVAKE